jgi:SAM-dependent methyltransferase
MRSQNPKGSANLRRLYADLAWIWPLVSPPEDYRDEAAEFLDLIETYAAGEAKTVLHLGCGAGHLDYHLKAWFQLTGVDLSLPMLEQARRLNPSVAYLQGDMRTIRLAAPFDVVILADASDYLITIDDLGAAIQTASHHLRKGGVFCTYAEEILERFENNKTRSTRHANDQIEITSIENVYDPDPTDSTYEMTFIYLIRKAGELSIEIDRHIAGIFSSADWIENLGAAGFEVDMIEYPEAGPGFIGRKL